MLGKRVFLTGRMQEAFEAPPLDPLCGGGQAMGPRGLFWNANENNINTSLTANAGDHSCFFLIHSIHTTLPKLAVASFLLAGGRQMSDHGGFFGATSDLYLYPMFLVDRRKLPFLCTISHNVVGKKLKVWLTLFWVLWYHPH